MHNGFSLPGYRWCWRKHDVSLWKNWRFLNGEDPTGLKLSCWRQSSRSMGFWGWYLPKRATGYTRGWMGWSRSFRRNCTIWNLVALWKWQDKIQTVSNAPCWRVSFSPKFDEYSVGLMAYRTEELERFVTEPEMFRLTPVANLISEQRQFVACYERPKVDFIQKLMGMKSLTYLRF